MHLQNAFAKVTHKQLYIETYFFYILHSFMH